MKLSLNRFASVCAIATAASFAVGSPADAAYLGTKTVSTTGARATCTVNTVSQFAADVSCSITDTAADGSTVYLRTKVLQFPEVRVNQTGGAGTTGYYSARRSGDSNFGFSIKVCRDRSWAIDNCSDWTSFS